MNTPTPVRVAIIGLGAVAEAHIAAYLALPEVEIVAVVDPRPERTAEVAARLSAPGFLTCAEMLEQIKPDIGCVLSTVASHRPITEQLANAGVHVLCEKPMTTSLEDALAMAEACRRNGVEYMYGSSYRFLPAVQLARRMIAEGVIGDVLLLEERVVTGAGAAAFKPMSSAHYPEGTPGGGGMGLVDHGVHLLDIFPLLTGSPITRAIGRGNRTGGPMRTEFALVELANGAIGSLIYEEGTVGSDMPWEAVFSMGRSWKDGQGFAGDTGEWTPAAGSIRVHGTRGALRIFHYPNKLFLCEPGGVREIAVPEGAAPDHFGAQLASFIAALRASEPSPVGAATGIQAVKTLLAIYRSEQTGQWTDVEA
jgi:predicted dehydrogenase